MKADETELVGSEIHDGQTLQALTFDRLRVVAALGRGAKGVVFLVEHENELLALKVFSRDLIEKKKNKKKKTAAAEITGENDGGADEYRRVCFEQRVLSHLRHPLLPRLRGVLDDSVKFVGFAIDYCPGRDLNALRKRQTERMFSDDVIRFYAAELVLALEYLHGLGIVYRDLKPENVMVQENGHIMIVDFDLSTKLSAKSPSRVSTSDSSSDSASQKRSSSSPPSPFHRWFCSSGISPEVGVVDSARTESDTTEKSNSFVGTEEYVAPEIVSGDGHDFAVDWWSLGIVLHEMLYGETPFRGANRKETFYRILTKRPELVGEATVLRDLIRRLLEKDPKERIKVDEIKGHDFFSGIDWESVVQISRPPYIPENDINEGKDVISNIDVELIVQGIFGDGDKIDDHSQDRQSNGYDHAENINTKIWVQGLSNNHPTQMDKFLVF